MKLTLSVGGGFTGLTKHSSIDVDGLDDRTHAALLQYIRGAKPLAPGNFMESWRLGGEQEVPVDNQKLTGPLKQLYADMKKNLHYSPR